MAENIVQIDGAEEINFYLRNYIYADMLSDMPILSFGIASDINRLLYKSALGAAYKIMLDSSEGANLADDKAMVTTGGGKAGVSSVTSTELGYLSGVTGGIQGQLNTKIESLDFLGLTDAPSAYTGEAGKLVAVNGDEDGVEFIDDWSGEDFAGITSTDISNWDTAYGWGNHASAGYLTSLAFTGLTDAPSAYTGEAGKLVAVNGDEDGVEFIDDWSGEDFAGITSTDISNWDTAYGWGDHSAVGYLTAVASNFSLSGDGVVGTELAFANKTNIAGASGIILDGFLNGAESYDVDDPYISLKYVSSIPKLVAGVGSAPIAELYPDAVGFWNMNTSLNLVAGSEYQVDGVDIVANASNWDDAYSHSQLTSGNPHDVDWSDLTALTGSENYLLYRDASGYPAVDEFWYRETAALRMQYGADTTILINSSYIYGENTSTPSYYKTATTGSNGYDGNEKWGIGFLSLYMVENDGAGDATEIHSRMGQLTDGYGFDFATGEYSGTPLHMYSFRANWDSGDGNYELYKSDSLNHLWMIGANRVAEIGDNVGWFGLPTDKAFAWNSTTATFLRDVKIKNDTDKYYAGADDDADIMHNGSNFLLTNRTGHFGFNQASPAYSFDFYTARDYLYGFRIFTERDNEVCSGLRLESYRGDGNAQEDEDTVAAISGVARDSGNNITLYGRIGFVAEDVTHGSEDARVDFQLNRANSQVTVGGFRDGLWLAERASAPSAMTSAVFPANAGQIWVRSSDGRLCYLDSDGLNVRPLNINTKSITIENPTSSEDIGMTFTRRAITVTAISAWLVGSGSQSVTYTIRHSTDRSATGNEVVTSGSTVTSVTTPTVVTSFNDATIPAASAIWLETTAKAGTVTELHVTIEYTED